MIITDLNMPRMDGLTFIRHARKSPAARFTPILMLTTESQQTKRAEARAAGATGWLVKPIVGADKLLASARTGDPKGLTVGLPHFSARRQQCARDRQPAERPNRRTDRGEPPLPEHALGNAPGGQRSGCGAEPEHAGESPALAWTSSRRA